MTFKSFLKELDDRQIFSLERSLDTLFSRLNVDVEFSNHFKERLKGRESEIKFDEIKEAFRKLFLKYRDGIIQDPELQGLLKDIFTYLNIPFGVHKKADGSYELRTITIMKKRNFVPNNSIDKVFTV